MTWWPRRLRIFVAEAMMAWHWEAELHHRSAAAVVRARLCRADAERRTWMMEGDRDREVLGIDRVAHLRAGVERHQLKAMRHREKRELWKRGVRD